MARALPLSAAPGIRSPRRRTPHPSWSAVAWLLAAALGVAGCGADEGLLGGRLSDLVAAGGFAVGSRDDGAGVQFPSPPRLARVDGGGEVRDAVVTAPGRWWWRGVVPADARLSGAVALVDAASASTLHVTITALLPFERRVLLSRSAGPGWLPLAADLSHLAGRRVELEVEARVEGRASGVAWSRLEVGARPASPRRPNIVLVLVDTLRADRLTVYGAENPTSPNVEALLARPGVVVERAYAPASWTMPSMAGLFASRWPGEIVDRAPIPLPADVPVLAEALQGLGYETAGFFGNPVLHAGTGFHRGFATVYCSDRPREAMERQHADHLTALATRWLAGRSGRPFFLYVHYVDPHDPYANPDTAGNRSPFYPEYRGEVAGDWVHGIYLGKMPLRHPAEDIRHLRALYDSEVRYFDRFFGGLLAALDPETRANTLFVLTADHGEELHEHGGWKHGRTVYEEQIRVPLVFRWDGRLPAGERVEGPARLIDVAPTLLRAAGGTPPPAWQGRDLLPLLRGQDRAPAGPLYARHLADGPLRAAALAGRWKLLLFDRYAPHTPPDAHQEILYRQEVARLERIELYDLQRDPGERGNVAAARPDLVRQLAPVIHTHLGREVPGLRVLLTGAPQGEPVELTLRFATAPGDWRSYFLGPEDEVQLVGDTLRLRLVGEALAKGVVVPEAAGAVTAAAVRAAVPVAIRPAGSQETREGAVPLGAMRHRGWPATGEQAAVLLWLPEAAAPSGDGVEVDPETRRRLEALGYTG